MTIFVRSLSIMMCMLILTFNNVFAQSSKEKELLLLLESYPEQNNQIITAYSLTTRNEIANLSLDNTQIIVDNSYPDTGSERWSKVTFRDQVVPVWVSEKFISQQNDTAFVTAKGLNARLAPSVNSEVVTVLSANYSSPILEYRNGFFKINAPKTTPFLVLKKRLNEINQSLIVYQGSANNRVNITQQAIKPTPVVQPVNVQQKSRNQQQIVNDSSLAHIIAPGDSISLLVFDEPDLSKENARVPESGNVSFPLIGVVNVSGKTTRQVEDTVKSILASGYVKNPQLSVSIFSYRPIFIRGAVQNTGAFPYTEGLSIAKALALAGGALNSAKPRGVRVLRDGKDVKSGLGLDSQYQIASGDVITVDEEQGVREDENLFIYLHGEVASPGEYRYRKGLTVEKAIVLSGGFTLRASRRKVSITRYVNVGENEAPEELKNVKLYTTVMPGDIIKVRASLF